jgi:hypothetical protein
LVALFLVQLVYDGQNYYSYFYFGHSLPMFMSGQNSFKRKRNTNG